MASASDADPRVLLQAAASGSFTGAARALGVSVSTVTRTVERVERSLGAKLFVRTAGGAAPTEAGRIYLEHAALVARAESEARAAIDALVRGEHGTLRVSVPMFVTQHILPEAVRGLAAAHPGARLTVHSSDDRVDLRGDGFDLAVRLGPLDDSSLHARRLATYRAVLVAGPRLRRACGRMQHPRELAGTACLAYGVRVGPVAWRLRSSSGERTTLAVEPILRSNDLTLLAASAAADLGVALLPEWLLPGTRSLRPVFEGWGTSGTLYALYPDDPGKARLRDALIQRIAQVAKRGPAASR